MKASTIENFRKTCTRVCEKIPSDYKWELDERFNVAYIVFEKDDMKRILDAVSKGFDKQWDSTIRNASKAIQKLVQSISGILSGQIIFTSPGEESGGVGLILFAAWWPWGDEDKISLRIGIYSMEDKNLDKDEIRGYLTEWFGL